MTPDKCVVAGPEHLLEVGSRIMCTEIEPVERAPSRAVVMGRMHVMASAVDGYES